MSPVEPAQARGRRRKEELLAAAVALLEEGGFVQVTHRAVADRAALPLSATTYYFRSRDDLLSQAFARLVDRDLAAMRERLRPIDRVRPSAVAESVVTALAPDDQRARNRRLALWELYVQVEREPSLRPVARAWTDGRHRIVAEALERAGRPHTPTDVRVLLATVESLLIENLVEARAGSARVMKEAVARLLTRCQAPVT